VYFVDGSVRELTVEDYLSIPAPRTHQTARLHAMLAEQHNLEPGTIAHVDLYNRRFPKKR